jgi:hypothetical protein
VPCPSVTETKLPSRIIPGFLVPILRDEAPLILGFFIVRALVAEYVICGKLAS